MTTTQNNRPDWNFISYLIFVALVFAIMCVALSSCGFVHKTFDKHKEKTDSTAVTHQAVDSVAKKDSIAVHKIQTADSGSIVIEFGDPMTVVNDSTIEIHDTAALRLFRERVANNKPYEGQYDFFYENGTLHTTQPIKRITITGTHKSASIDTVAKHEVVAVKKEQGQETTLKRSTTTVEKEVKRWSFNWWWLLLLLIIPIWRNWPKIKAFI
jgi:hypothetical protein